MNTTVDSYYTWLSNEFFAVYAVWPFMFATFLFFTLGVHSIFTEMATKKQTSGRLSLAVDGCIMSGFGGTLVSIYIASIIAEESILDALSGALVSSIYGVSSSLMLTLFDKRQNI